jgi:hypothetical protein
MADFTNALTRLDQVVTDFLLGYYKSTNDYVQYMKHACQVVQDFNLYDGNLVVTAKVSLNTTLKCIEMPVDMIQFVDIVTPQRGSWWSFTEKDRMVNTTTFTGGVEGRDSTQGEGQIIDQSRVTTYGAKGGVNKFKYTLDWQARRIYVDDTYTANDYIVLMYVSSGIKATEETLVPVFMIPLIESYLLERETYWIDSLVRERPMRHEEYTRKRQDVRNLVNSMSMQQWKDLIYSTASQSPQR